MDMSQLTMGVWPFIESGIREFIREHGEPPESMVVHPRVGDWLCTLRIDPAIADSLRLMQFNLTEDVYAWLPYLKDKSGKCHLL